MKGICLRAILLYQRLSRGGPPRCRFVPSCSAYAYDAVERYGAWYGSWLALGRLARCHPLHAGGLDPLR